MLLALLLELWLWWPCAAPPPPILGLLRPHILFRVGIICDSCVFLLKQLDSDAHDSSTSAHKIAMVLRVRRKGGKRNAYFGKLLAYFGVHHGYDHTVAGLLATDVRKLVERAAL